MNIPGCGRATRPLRRYTLVLLLGGSLFGGTGCLFDRLGGAFTQRPEGLQSGLSPAARRILDEAFEGIEPEGFVDAHVHVVGLGVGGTGAYVNPRMQSLLSPSNYARYRIYLSASAVKDLSQADDQYMTRLLSLAEHMPVVPRLMIYAFDRKYRGDGTVDEEKTMFYVPNSYVFALAQRFPDRLTPVMSIHPYREDALQALHRWADRGGRYMKWLPNTMGMDPSDPRLEPFYRAMVERGVVLITHAGDESAVESDGGQSLGNPLKLRYPLGLGVTVVVAHCASLGEGRDLDFPDEERRVSNFDLFMRLMHEPAYDGLLFGDISATTQFNRLPVPLATLLKRKDLHHRLINGSDYPLPAINVLVRTSTLVDNGFLSARERPLLNEIYQYNPLLYDFVVKRSVHGPQTADRFPDSVFMQNPRLPR